MTDEITVRALQEGDLAAIVRIDARQTGRERPEYFKLKLANALRDTGIRLALAAEQDGRVVGFLLGHVYYGDYGQPESVATLDAIGVQPELARAGVGTALWRQFAHNVKGLRVDRVDTQVDWAHGDLIAFLRHAGFRPSSRICLERPLDFEADD